MKQPNLFPGATSLALFRFVFAAHLVVGVVALAIGLASSAQSPPELGVGYKALMVGIFGWLLCNLTSETTRCADSVSRDDSGSL